MSGKPTRLTEFFDQGIEPKALCRNCEYFDGGGLDVKGNPINDIGDCRNRRVPYFQTYRDNGCIKFFPCNTRWPDADHD